MLKRRFDYKKGRLIPRKKHGKPMRFVGIGVIAMIVILYLLLMRPQQKRQKEHKMMLSTMRKGDKVVTNSGMFGTIVGINDTENKVVLKVAENVKIEFLKSSIAGRVGTEE